MGDSRGVGHGLEHRDMSPWGGGGEGTHTCKTNAKTTATATLGHLPGQGHAGDMSQPPRELPPAINSSSGLTECPLSSHSGCSRGHTAVGGARGGSWGRRGEATQVPWVL